MQIKFIRNKKKANCKYISVRGNGKSKIERKLKDLDITKLFQIIFFVPFPPETEKKNFYQTTEFINCQDLNVGSRVSVMHPSLNFLTNWEFNLKRVLSIH